MAAISLLLLSFALAAAGASRAAGKAAAAESHGPVDVTGATLPGAKAVGELLGAPQNLQPLALRTALAESASQAPTAPSAAAPAAPAPAAPGRPTIVRAPGAVTGPGAAVFVVRRGTATSKLECRVDRKPFRACAATTRVAGQTGSHVFSVRGRGPGGASPVATYAWKTTAGAPRIVGAPLLVTTSATARFAFERVKGVAAYECSLDGSRFAPCASPRVYTGLTRTTHVFRVRAAAAIRATTAVRGRPAAQYRWRVQPGQPLTPPTKPVEGGGSESGGSAGGAGGSGGSTGSFGGASAGSGGGSTSEPPATPLVDAGPGTVTSSTAATFAFHSPTAGAGYECSVDPAGTPKATDWSACASPVTLTGVSDGSHAFWVRAVSAGGASAAVSSGWIVLLPPTMTAAPPALSSSTTATFRFSSGYAEATFECSLDGAAFAACAAPAVLTGLALGEHAFRVRAVADGFAGDPVAVTWTIARAPETPTVSDRPSDPTEETSATFAFSTSEDGDTFECSLDGAAFAACTSPLTTPQLAEGTHQFAVRARNAAGTSDAATVGWAIAPLTLKAKLLVVSATGDDTDLDMVKDYLGRLGVPFDVLVASTTDLTAATLSSGLTGNYQGVVLTSGSLVWQPSPGVFESAFTADEWNLLWAYEARFRVRQVTTFTAPYPLPGLDYGLTLSDPQFVDTLATPQQATLTDAGKAVFDDLNPDTPVTLEGAFLYRAHVTDPGDTSVTPLLVTGDGQVVASVKSHEDGRENLAVTVANGPGVAHSWLLAHGLVSWVTRGVFLGERHVNVDVQIDDLLIPTDMWDAVNHTDSESVGVVPDIVWNGGEYRLSAGDFQALKAWQAGKRSNPLLAGLRLEWAFNGEGAFGDDEPIDFAADPVGILSPYRPDATTPDPLTQAVAGDDAFGYLNHTYRHENLDLTSLETAVAELTLNQQAAARLANPHYTPQGMVQPDISGLTNAAFLQAAFDAGLRYLITDVSAPGWGNPSPNAGFLLGADGSHVFAVPRRANNLFYNLRTPAEWVDKFNCFYWSGAPSVCAAQYPAFRTLASESTYEQILDREADNLFMYMLQWDLDPWMFHQANVGQFEPGKSLLSELLDAAFAKYLAAVKLPVRNVSLEEAGELMQERMSYDASGAAATITACRVATPGAQPLGSITVETTAAGSVPVTGVAAGSGTETYGGERISTLSVSPGQPVTLALDC